jgi:hypothetical protein
MRRIGATIAAAALAAALAPAAHGGHTTVIRLISNFRHADVDDRSPKGEVNAGDVIVSFDRLSNATAQFGRPKGAKVGHDRGRFTFLTATQMHVDGWTTLPGGRIHVRGLVRKVRGEIVAMRVVCGLGAFSGARGTVTVTPYPTTARTLIVYRLRLG